MMHFKISNNIVKILSIQLFSDIKMKSYLYCLHPI